MLFANVFCRPPARGFRAAVSSVKTLNSFVYKKHEVREIQYLSTTKVLERVSLHMHQFPLSHKVKNDKYPQCFYSMSDSGDLSRHIKCVLNKVKNDKYPQCFYSMSDSGDLSRHIKCVLNKVKNTKCPQCLYSLRFS
jgi:hypothetical protein